MTTQEYLTHKLSRLGLTADDLAVIITENNLQANEAVNIEQAKSAMYNSLSQWLPLHSQITEGGVSEHWNFDALRIFYALLCKDLGKENILQALESRNTIEDKSFMW